MTNSASMALRPHFDINGSQDESSELKAVMAALGMQKHPEGGYFVVYQTTFHQTPIKMRKMLTEIRSAKETDRDPHRIPNPLPKSAQATNEDETRSASTTIHYLLTPKSPLGAWHRNKARTVHTLHRGRGRYVIIHADEVAAEKCPGGYGDADVSEESRWIKKARVEVFTVGQNVLKGEKLQWIVDGGKYKTSFLLPDQEGSEGSEGLLISETVVPGFEYSDHDFMKKERLEALVSKGEVAELEWMLRKE
ncbi:uncharacterized protein RHO25_001127 [Cercospora beticola]|uniref:DUF985 domain-containing protein n=1 Tax=Cercospora beticola TaxID=122368 RepID=A0ABZ0NAG5_CERBT|nr:hypothetical protein RHO25_001127 [Cercospora beticola]